MVQVVQTIYMKANKLNLIQIGFVYSIYQLSKFVFEVPTGIVADRYGRRISTIWGLVSLIVSLVLVILNTTFYSFIIAAFIQGISYTFISGASDALYIDSIFSADEKRNFEKYNAKARTLCYFAIFASSILGGYIAEKSLFYVYILTIVSQFIPVVILILFVVEPPYKDVKAESVSISNVVKSICNNKLVMWLLSIDIIISISLIPIEAHYFNYFKTIGISENLSGLIYGIQYLASSLIGMLLAKVFVNILGKKVIFVLPPIMILCIVAFACVSNPIVKNLFYFLGLLMLCCFSPTKSLFLHSNIESTYRASILSFQSICMSLLAFLFHPLFGYIADKEGYSVAMALISILSFILMVFACTQIYKIIRNNLYEKGELTDAR